MVRAPVTATAGRPTQVVVALLVVTFALVAAFGTTLVVHEYVTPIPRIKSLVNLNGEANVPAWWNGALLMTIGFGALVVRTLDADRLARRAWLAVAVAGLALSLDEIAGLHERLNDPVRELGIDIPTFAWLVPGVLVAAALFAALVLLGRALPGRTRGWLLVALVLFLSGALGVEAINGTLRGDGELIYYWIGTTLEEAMEMVACVIAIGAIARVIADRLPRSTAATDSAPVAEGLVSSGAAGASSADRSS